MITQEQRDEYTRDLRDFIGLNGDFATFVAWRQMKALEGIAGRLQKLTSPPVMISGPYHDHLRPGTDDDEQDALARTLADAKAMLQYPSAECEAGFHLWNLQGSCDRCGATAAGKQINVPMEFPQS